ncbi:cyclic nucleotide-binding protein [Longibacter salinarum]|uniref:Cyclic nucleotide-binding protein n=1 Tax=Longibacter salinarum TaxID=1850348 RepID=A0A2A8D2T2_9BACT|nr:putative nucleotidyltransferase substrate binding domain-containing protein [Longibacter salinarum]PEN15256.1 cyclic nucleotide-binding protein [Longibacter salinarum]
MSSRETEPIEIIEIADFLSSTPPFTELNDDGIRTAARSIDITYAPSGSVVLDIGDAPEALFLIRSGAVELHNDADVLVARLGEHEFFGYPSLLTGAPASRRVTTIEDTLLYHIPEALFDRCRSESDAFDRFFARAHAERVHDAVHEGKKNVPLTTPLRRLLSRSPVTASPDTSIRRAAETMRDQRVSSLLLTDDSTLVGLITDRDLRNRVLAAGVSPDDPVSTVMTNDPNTIGPDALAFEAMLSMSRHNVHHLPVVDGEGLHGMVTTTDLIRQQVDSPVYLVGEVWKCDSVERLATVSRQIPSMLRQMVAAGARADDAGRMVTAVTDALTERLIELAIDELGEPPTKFAWLALGSQARHEQTAHSDQDNALVLANDATEENDAYFFELATFVCDGLNACGYEYCPGEVMATTDRWRQPTRDWKHTFRNWIEEPHPKALMHSTIFFDLRHIYGDDSLTRELQAFVLDRTAKNTIFLASLAATALDNKPPLGFFRQFVLEEHGNQKDTLDLKLNGVVPIVDLARINALGNGVSAVNTLERFTQLADRGAMNADDAADLRDAYEFIATVRLQHQVDQIRQGIEPDNYVSPNSLSDFDRRHLKDAFRIVSRMQSALSQRYQTSFIS